MLHAPPDIFAAMHRPSIRKKIRVKWILRDTNELDLTDRVISLGAVRRTLKPLLGGYRGADVGIELRNSDHFLHPTDPGSYLFKRLPEEYIGSKLTIEQAVFGDENGFQYIPVWTGNVKSLAYADKRVEMAVADRASRFIDIGLSDTVTLDHSTTPSEQLADLLTSESDLETADLDTAGSFQFAEDAQRELHWTTYGQLPIGSSLFRVATDLARSGGGVMYPDEVGVFKYDVELPNRIDSDILRGLDIYPVVFHAGDSGMGPANSSNFSFMRAASSTASEVVAKYMGVFTPTVSFDRKAALGGLLVQKRINMPYLTTMRCADLMSRILYEGLSGYVDLIKWTTHGLGLLAQLNDRVRVKLPGSSEVTNYRILSKAWNRKSVELEAVKESHIDTIIDATLAEWSLVQNYGHATRFML